MLAGFRSRWMTLLLVRGLQRFGDLQRDAQSFLDLHRSALQALGQRLAFDQLHDEDGQYAIA